MKLNFCRTTTRDKNKIILFIDSCTTIYIWKKNKGNDI